MTSTIRSAMHRAEIRAADLETAILMALDRLRTGRTGDARAILEKAVPDCAVLRPSWAKPGGAA